VSLCVVRETKRQRMREAKAACDKQRGTGGCTKLWGSIGNSVGRAVHALPLSCSQLQSTPVLSRRFTQSYSSLLCSRLGKGRACKRSVDDIATIFN
jgi:hypothetical protein